MAIQKRAVAPVSAQESSPVVRSAVVASKKNRTSEKKSGVEKTTRSSQTPIDAIKHLEHIKHHLFKGLLQKDQLRQTLWESPEGQHRRRFIHVFKDVEEGASLLAHDVSVALSERIEDLSVTQPEFKSGMVRVCARTLKMCQSHQESVVVFNEAVPGFTAIVFRQVGARALTAVEMEVVAALIQRFVSRTHDRVLTIHCNDALWLFLPALDMKKNVREMGFYITEEGPSA